MIGSSFNDPIIILQCSFNHPISILIFDEVCLLSIDTLIVTSLLLPNRRSVGFRQKNLASRSQAKETQHCIVDFGGLAILAPYDGAVDP